MLNTTFLKWVKQNVILFAFIILFIIFSVSSSSFTQSDNLINITRQISFIGIAAIGMMFVLLTGGIDLSIGSLIQLVNVVCARLMVHNQMSPIFAIMICLLLALSSGVLNGTLIAKLKVPPFIITLASMNVLKGAAFLISDGRPVYGFPENFSVLGQGYVGVIPIPTILMILMFLAGAFILNKLPFGRSLYAIGGNEEATRLSGIHVDRVKIIAYACSSVFACISGLLMLSRLFSGTPNTGAGYEFQVITAVVLGGVSVTGGYGRIFSVVFGVLIMGVLNNGLILLNFNTYWQDVISGLVLAAAVSMDYLSKHKALTAKDVGSLDGSKNVKKEVG